MRNPQEEDDELRRCFAELESFVLLVAASKGGVGKSTLAIHLAVLVHLMEIRTVILDTDIEDEQQSCVMWAGTRKGPGPDVVKVAPSRLAKALIAMKQKGYRFIVIDTPGRDMVSTKAALDRADFMVTPSLPSPLDLRGTAPIRRLWSVSTTPAAIVLNGVTRENVPRTQRYIDQYAEQGIVLPAVVGRRVQYIDSLERGLGVSEYRPGDVGDRETCRLLLAIFAEIARRKA
jgi:chromosome partitioning protein